MTTSSRDAVLSPKLKSWHFDRSAVVYIRQSTPQQGKRSAQPYPSHRRPRRPEGTRRRRSVLVNRHWSRRGDRRLSAPPVEARCLAGDFFPITPHESLNASAHARPVALRAGSHCPVARGAIDLVPTGRDHRSHDNPSLCWTACRPVAAKPDRLS